MDMMELDLDRWAIECEELVHMVAEASKLRHLKSAVKKNFPDFWPEE